MENFYFMKNGFFFLFLGFISTFQIGYNNHNLDVVIGN